MGILIVYNYGMKLFNKTGFGKKIAAIEHHISDALPIQHDKKLKLGKDVVVKLEKVSKKFGNFAAVNNVSFEIKKGEIVGLVGANGAGKTTISEMIVGLTKPTSGQIEYGFNYDKVPQEKIGMQFQDASYPSGLSIKDVIKFAQKVHGLKMSKKELKSLLRVFQIDDFYNKKPRSLSGGQRQKLNIFMSILHKPELVILDELSTGLDISAREEIISFTKQLIRQNGLSAIVISHQMEELKDLCDRLIILDKGKVKLETTIKEIEKKQPLADFMRKLINDSRGDSANEVDLKLDGWN